jgi:cytosine/uracil/thiamine/allantoin permease
MKEEIIELKEDISSSPLYSEDIAPVPKDKRTWGLGSLAAIWIGMAVCIPTYILASYMIKNGISWYISLIIIGLANIIIAIPMVLNGHAGVKYGIPFPVLGRSSFGIKGVHVPSVMRAFVACGWFGVQTWIGGLSFYAIWNAITGSQASVGLDVGKFVCFFLFWLVNIYFIWNGTNSIKWLEVFSAPILLLIGVLLIIWGTFEAKGFKTVIDNGSQIQNATASLSTGSPLSVTLNPLKNQDGSFRASEYQISVPLKDSNYRVLGWQPLTNENMSKEIPDESDIDKENILNGQKSIKVQFRAPSAGNNPGYVYSSEVNVNLKGSKEKNFWNDLWKYILWLTAMVGFWATMSISISDITRYSKGQKEQFAGQMLGLPGTMVFYSFVGIFVTYAAVVNFKDLLISEDAPWDPVSLLSRFQSPTIVIVSQIAMLIATLSTNIAANVIAPANAFSNLFPKKLSFRGGGIVTGLIGIAICPWWVLDEISNILIFVSGLLGPVLGIFICDYFVIRKKELKLPDLYKIDGIYSYSSGFNSSAMFALLIGILSALIGKWIPQLEFLFNLSWFTGFSISFAVYYSLMKMKKDVSVA